MHDIERPDSAACFRAISIARSSASGRGGYVWLDCIATHALITIFNSRKCILVAVTQQDALLAGHVLASQHKIAHGSVVKGVNVARALPYLDAAGGRRGRRRRYVRVANSNNVCLHCVIGSVRCHPGHHEALVKLSHRTIRHVSAGSEDDGALLVHWLVRVVSVTLAGTGNRAIWTWAVVHGHKRTAGCVTTLESKAVGAAFTHTCIPTSIKKKTPIARMSANIHKRGPNDCHLHTAWHCRVSNQTAVAGVAVAPRPPLQRPAAYSYCVGNPAGIDGHTQALASQVERCEREGEGFVLIVLFGGVAATVIHAALEVCADPWPGFAITAVALPVRIAEVDGLHCASTETLVVGSGAVLGIAVIEAATAVVVGAAHHGVHRFGIVAGGDAVRSVNMVAVTCGLQMPRRRQKCAKST